LLRRPHRGCKGAILPEIPRWADASAPSPFYPWDWLPAHPKQAMMIIKRLKLTGAGHPGFSSFNGVAGGPGSLALAFGCFVAASAYSLEKEKAK
jgi:hypothetical protein